MKDRTFYNIRFAARISMYTVQFLGIYFLFIRFSIMGLGSLWSPWIVLLLVMVIVPFFFYRWSTKPDPYETNRDEKKPSALNSNVFIVFWGPFLTMSVLFIVVYAFIAADNHVFNAASGSQEISPPSEEVVFVVHNDYQDNFEYTKSINGENKTFVRIDSCMGNREIAVYVGPIESDEHRTLVRDMLLQKKFGIRCTPDMANNIRFSFVIAVIKPDIIIIPFSKDGVWKPLGVSPLYCLINGI